MPAALRKIESAQWESNPHIRHGKAVGCRYIMGAWLVFELPKIKPYREAAIPLMWSAKWAGRRSNPRLRFFRPPLDRLSYQPQSS